MLTEKIFRRHKLDTTRIIATKELDASVTLVIMEDEVATTTMKLPEGRDLNAFAEGMLIGIEYQQSETWEVKLKNAEKQQAGTFTEAQASQSRKL